MSGNEWRIQLYDSTNCVWESRVPLHRMSIDALFDTMRCLVSQTLTPDEIVGSMVNKRRGGDVALSHLKVSKDVDHKRRRTVYMCGSNPHVIATTVKVGSH